METETITIRVTPDAARIFNTVSADEQRKLEALLSLRLLELSQEEESLEDIMRNISRKAQARGLTPEILESILNDE
jgi:Mg/Co/Ni transporter MgtE